MPRPRPRVETRSRLAVAPRVRQAPPFAGHALTAVSTRPCWVQSGRRSHCLRRHVADARVRELLHQPVLQRAKHPLAAPARLRRVGRYVLNPEPIERTTHLGPAILVYRLASLVAVKIMTAAVGVERTRKSMRAEHFQQAAEGRSSAFLLHQK